VLKAALHHAGRFLFCRDVPAGNSLPTPVMSERITIVLGNE
jgi:hypothetical protein